MIGSLLLVVTLALGAPAGGPARELALAEAQAENLDYEPALRRLEDVLETLPDSDPLAVRIHVAAGCLAVILEQDDDARAHFTWVLSRDPRTALEGPSASSPKIQDFYEEVRADVVGQGGGRVFSAVAIAGGAVAVLGGAVAAWQNGVAGDRDAPLAERRDAQTFGRASLAVAAVGVVAAVVGGALLLSEEGGFAP